MRHHYHVRLFVFVAFAAVACSAPPRKANHVDPLALDASTIAKLDARCASRISRSPFAYFRFTNRPFVDLVCDRYAGAIASMPLVHSHGDAHIEQYAVAAEGRGLADYDASAIGPPVVDLTRFATSLVLAWPDDPAAARVAIEAFLRGYARALEDPTTSFREPVAAARLRARFAPTRLEWLDRAEKLIVPIAPDTDVHDAKQAWSELMAQIRSTNPDLAPSFFSVKVGGQLDLGIGSYHAHKFLVRIEGPTPAPEDDLMVEAKALEQHTLGACMRGADLDASRVVRGQSQISNAPQRFLGAVTIHGKPFYSHTWLTHYTELSTSDVGSAEELAELAEDVGVQLGKGHGKTVDRGQEASRRRALQRTIAAMRPRLDETAFELAVHVRRTWNEFIARDPGERTAAR
jgi:uncharacterized protein (DUF2252 family)